MNVVAVYKIICIASAKFYIGSSINIKQRFAGHKRQLRAGTHRNIPMQHSWNKHGEESFIFEILELCSLEDLRVREQYFMDTLKPQFNLAPLAGTCLGCKWTDEQKLKIAGRKLPSLP